MRQRVIIGGAVYRQALQAPKEDVFKVLKPELARMYSKVLAMKKYMRKKFQSDPTVFLDVMGKLLPHIPRIPTISDSQKLDKWASYFGNIGLKLIDNSEAMKNDLPRIQKNVETLEKFRQQAEAKSKIDPDPGYVKVVEVINGFLKDMKTPVV